MALTTTHVVNGPYAGTGAVDQEFAVTFQSESEEGIEVLLDGVVVDIADYTFDRDADGRGTVIATLDGEVYIYSKPVFTQQAVFERFGPFFPDNINTYLDKAAARIQYLNSKVDVVYPDGARLAADRAGLFMAWDAAGEPVPASGTGADDGLRADVAAPNGSTLLGFLQAGVGAVARTAQGKMRDVVDLFDFIDPAKHAGILASTNTDDLTAEVQAALDSGKPVRVPLSGRVWVSDIIKPPSNGGFIGDGRLEIKAMADFGQKPVIQNVTTDPATLAARDTNIILTGIRVNGNKANNTTATEFGHGIQLNAVDGALLDVHCVDCKGDGVLLMWARLLDGSSNHYDVGCNDIRGFARVENCARQGFSIICCENFNLTIFAYQIDLFGVDIEPDHVDNYVRNGSLKVFAQECGQAGAGTRGGVQVHGTNSIGTGRCDVRDLDITAFALDCEGTAGIAYRDIRDVEIRGFVDGQTGVGILGIDTPFSHSHINFDVTVISSTGSGVALNGNGNDVISGRIHVYSAGAEGLTMATIGGRSKLDVKVAGAGGQGIVLNNVDNQIFLADLSDCSGSGVLLVNGSTGNRFPNLKSTGSTNGFGFEEQAASGCDDNQATNAQVTGNGGGAVSLVGASSLVVTEQLVGKAALTFGVPGAVPGLSAATANITVTGAAVGDIVEVVAPIVTPANYLKAEGEVTAADAVLIRYLQYAGAAAAIANGTYKVLTKRLYTA